MNRQSRRDNCHENCCNGLTDWCFGCCCGSSGDCSDGKEWSQPCQRGLGMRCQIGGWMQLNYCWCVDRKTAVEINNTRTWKIHELRCDEEDSIEKEEEAEVIVSKWYNEKVRKVWEMPIAEMVNRFFSRGWWFLWWKRWNYILTMWSLRSTRFWLRIPHRKKNPPISHISKWIWHHAKWPVYPWYKIFKAIKPVKFISFQSNLPFIFSFTIYTCVARQNSVNVINPLNSLWSFLLSCVPYKHHLKP